MVGGLAEIRMFTLLKERNIRRIGSLQSPFNNDGVVGVVFEVGDGLLRLGDREEGDDGSSSRHHTGVSFSMAAPTMLSPSSFPPTSDKMSESGKRGKTRHKPLKIIASLGTQTLPKARDSVDVSRNTRPVGPELSVRTLILRCRKVLTGSVRNSPPYFSGNVGSNFES